MTATITGLPAVQKMLTEAPRLIVAEGFLKAANAGVRVMEQAVYDATPERDEGDRDESEGHLRDVLKHQIEIDAQFRGVRASIGFGRLSQKALWVEYGHEMVIGRGKRKGQKVGFVPAHPFMRPAYAASAEPALAAFADSLTSTMRNL